MDVADLVAVRAHLRNDAHCGMMRIDAFRERGNVVDRRPDRGVVSVAFHFVANAPHEQRGMILVLQNRGFGFFVLLADLIGVVVVKAVARMFKPDTDRERETKFVSLVESLLNVVSAPRTTRVRTDTCESGL